MKSFILILTIVFGTIQYSLADQLAYISKKEAKKAMKLLKKMDHVVLYCGCCDNDRELTVSINSVKVSFTDYENYYEVILTYTDRDGNSHSEGIDLAYVWDPKQKKTMGELLNLEHDPCERIQ